MITKILHISDTHGMHSKFHNLPDADVIVHSGDFTINGNEQEVYDFLQWFLDLPYKHKLFIAGNHDTCLCGADIEGLDKNCHYLNNSSVLIEDIKFFGMPMFVDNVINDYKNVSEIPAETKILITHQPPFGILDYVDGTHYGSEELLNKIAVSDINCHLFGHTHSCFGEIPINGIRFSNASMSDNEYRPQNRFRLINM